MSDLLDDFRDEIRGTGTVECRFGAVWRALDDEHREALTTALDDRAYSSAAISRVLLKWDLGGAEPPTQAVTANHRFGKRCKRCGLPGAE